MRDRSKSLVLPIFCVTIFAAVCAILLGIAGAFLSSAHGTSLVPLALIAVSLLGTAVMQVVTKLDVRIQDLERKLAERDVPEKKPGTKTDSAPQS